MGIERGQMWRRRAEPGKPPNTPMTVHKVGSSEVTLSDNGTVLVTSMHDFETRWERVDNQTVPSVKDVLGACARTALLVVSRDDMVRLERITEVLRTELTTARSNLPDWMEPAFWSFEDDPYLPEYLKGVRIIPTILAGHKVKQTYDHKDNTWVLEDGTLIVKCDDPIEGLIALARIVIAKQS